ncbi:MAG: 30S ribosomal protein S4 [Thermoprotei archaeon]
MGDPRRTKKKWRGPRHPWRTETLKSELELVGKYGLRNKRELWIARTLLRNIRIQARTLLALKEDERNAKLKILVNRLYKLGLISQDATIDDILGLTVEDVLNRRLQTIVYKLGLARTIYQARQFIVHKHVRIGGKIVSRPGYLVKKEEEALITCDVPLIKVETSKSSG